VSNTYNIANTYTDRLILVISSLQKVGFDAEVTISAQLHVTHQINLQPDTQQQTDNIPCEKTWL